MFIAALCIIAKCSKQPKCPLLDEQIKKLWYIFLTYGQDGGIGRHTLPPCTTKRRTTTNLKTKKKPQNCQKIELYGSLTSKELKKKQSSRLVGGAETGSWGGEDSWQGGSWRPRMGKVVAGGPGGPTFAYS